MQEDIEGNLPPPSHSRSPSDSLDDGGEKKEIKDTVDENLAKQKNAFISPDDDKKEADGDIVMEDVTQDEEKLVATACTDRAMAVEKNKGKERGVDHAGNDLSGDKGDVKQENHGSDEWQFVPDSNGTHKSHLEDEMSYKVSVAGSSDDEFSFGSKEDEDTIRDDALMIKPFSMDLLRDCIARGEESLCEIEGKDVVLVVGKTGTGKSTFIQGIAGKTFKKASHSFECQGWNKKVRKDVFDAEDPMCGFEIGHAKSSMTKHIRCYLRHCSTEDDSRGGKSIKAPSMMYYLDTPGFEDTDGEEVDIATSAMLGQVAKKSRSIRFVVMINYVSLLEDRGGAMRSILKFMRNFVDDFDANKKSFLFLFSHADEIKDIPESLEGAKRSLLNEILLTIDGNADAKDLLSFIKKCLTKGYPFVDVFHPLKTDFSEMTKFIEQKLKPINCNEPGKYRKNVGLTSSSFTTSSKMRLMGAVQKQLRNLRILFRRSPVVIEDVREIQQTFRFFDKYIQFREMRNAVVECEELIIEHVKYLRGVIEEEVRKGSTMSSDAVFNEVNIARLKDAILQLQVIDSETFNVQAECNRITRDLKKFQDALLRETDGSTNKIVDFYGFSENLRKLNAWSILDPSYSVFFDSVVDHTNAIVKRVTDDACNIQMSAVCSPSTTADEMQELTLVLSTLKSIKENMQGLSSYLSGVSGASAAFDDFTNRLKSHVKALGEIHSTDSKEEEFGFGNKQYVKDLTTRIRSLDVVSELINAVKLQDDVSSLVRSVKEVIEYQTVDNYLSACLQFEESCRHKFNGACEGLTILRDAMSIFSSIEESRWKKINFSYNTQVERIKSLLKIKSGQLMEMTQYALQHGLRDAERLGKAASDFETCQWFDEFLPVEERFVRDSLVKLNDDLLRRFTATSGSINNMFINSVTDATILECQQDSMKVITTLRNALPEISEYALYASVVGDEELTIHTTQIFSAVKSFTKSRAICWQNDLNAWVQLTSNENNDFGKLNIYTEKLNFAIYEINELSALSSKRCTAEIVSLSQPILDDIIARFSTLKQQVQDSLKSEITYEEFTTLLARVEALEAFPHTARHLPSLEQLKQVVSERVSCDVKIIEDMIEQSADFDKIDEQIKEFEQAVLLDRFVSHEVSNRLRSLKILLTGKESDVDEMITKMIHTNDFSGLREFLQPLAHSKNQIRRTKFKKSVGRIAESFKSFEGTLRNEIDGKLMTREKGMKIASCLKILEEIIHEAGEYLEPASSTSSTCTTSSTIELRLKDYKKQLNSRLCELQDRMSFAIDKADFLALAKHHHQTTIFSDQLGQYLTKFSREKIETNTTKLSDLKGSIPSSIEAFVRSSFTESGEIEIILTGLKSTLTIEDPFFSDLSQLYIDNTNSLTKQVKEVVQTLKHETEDTLCYDDSITIIHNLLRSIHSGLKGHLPDEVLDQATMLSSTWIEARENQQFDMEFEGKPIDLVIKTWTERLENSAPSSKLVSSLSKFFTGKSTSRTYDRLQKELRERIEKKYAIGRQALQRREFASLAKCFEFLKLVGKMTEKHVPSARNALRLLEREAVDSFQVLCEEFKHAIQSKNYWDFESFLPEFRGFVLNVTCLTKDRYAVMSFHRTNELVYKHFCEQISFVDKALNGIEFRTMKQKVEDTRIFGGLVADWYSLLYEELKEYPQIYHDEWLEMLKNEIQEHFRNGRDLKRIKLYAVIGVVPSVSKEEINRAFRQKSRTCHPDKCIDQRHAKEWEEKFKMLQNARDELNEHFSLKKEHLKKPFDDDIRDLGHRLRELTKRALAEQHYAHVSCLLFNMFGINVMDSLVSPKLETEKIRDDVIRLVEHHVEKVLHEADSNWSERKYQSLNLNIKDLKMMQLELSSHPNVFPASWNRGIIEKVEGEILNLEEHARTFLRDKKVADANIDQFRRLFTQMGAVLVELPDLKDFTKGIMSEILDSCLDWDWGYVFLFKLGLSLQGGSDTASEDNAHLTQNLLSEFSHFKDVLTMVWNEETIQKPPEETVGKICGEYIKSAWMNSHSASFTSLDIDSEELLNYFFEFNSLYTSFLGDYLNPKADVKVLVRKTIDRCELLKPLSCDDGFSVETKSVLPTIIAGIFAVFTILKSGESFNRLEEDAIDCKVDAKQLLMKPHNIQVLTLLCMFGCGMKRSSSLKSQLMQVRTGEGKSIILGAAATVLGLLGFRVRCVCYSEYLSKRDFELFFEVFDHFGLSESVKYSSIGTLSEDTIKRKGDIRVLTESLLRGQLSTSSKIKEEHREEILLVDEVDVFFGSDFYGRTHNPVFDLKEPEAIKIIKRIWDGRKEGQTMPYLHVIKAMPEYQSLKQKFPGFDYLLELEVTTMLSDVCHFNSPPYFLNRGTDKIGYKEHDGVSYTTSYGYRTMFAYMQEADDGNLKDPDRTLSEQLAFSIMCGRFSFANIKPKRILGVSGTLEAMTNYEKGVLEKYGVSQYLYIPSVYERSNLTFDKAGDGISIEKSVDDFFQKITKEIKKVATTEKRAVIVFFKNKNWLDKYTSSAFYRKLERKKAILDETTGRVEKAFVISKAASSGQVTLCSSAFGRGTDFFCKDNKVEANGGVQVVQAFFSAHKSEEIQIQGRTARQGKQGSYKLILLDKDLEEDFNIERSSIDSWPKAELYEKLCDARNKFLEEEHVVIEKRLSEATKVDKMTHDYFNALLEADASLAKELFKRLYLNCS